MTFEKNIWLSSTKNIDPKDAGPMVKIKKISNNEYMISFQFFSTPTQRVFAFMPVPGQINPGWDVPTPNYIGRYKTKYFTKGDTPSFYQGIFIKFSNIL